MAKRKYVIIEMTKDRLAGRTEQERYGWNGTNANESNARHLGIYDTALASTKNGLIAIYTLRAVADYGGWGFGHRMILDDAQGYAWNGEPVEKMVFEIAVKSTPLTAEESKRLLKKKK
ncbi:MAG: hypothetical protein JWO38_3073 [Gemmataceae bacterium]|nr:hypothetical protein [Gemmataceae bacterium]